MRIEQSTAVILKLGPFLDEDDGKTPETGLTIVQADIQISKNGGAFAQTSDASPTTTHDADGWYPIPLTATDTNTLGHIVVQVHAAGALPVWAAYEVCPADVYGTMIQGDDALPAQVEGMDNGVLTADAIAGDAITADKIADAAIGADQLADGAIANAKIADAAISDAKIAGDAITADKIADDAIAAEHLATDCITNDAVAASAAEEIRDAIVDDATRIDASALNTLAGHDPGSQIAAQSDVTGLNDVSSADVETACGAALTTYDPPTKAEMDTGFAGLNDPSAADVADAVCDEALSGHTTAGTLAKAIADIEVDTGTSIPALIAALPTDADVLAQVNAGLVANHLDHLLAQPFDPATPPGSATSLWNILLENDSGVPRFTTNALENGPGGADYLVWGWAIQDEDNNIEWQASCLLNGQPQTGATNCVVQIVSSDGDGTTTDVSGATETVASPDDRGVFNGTVNTALTAGEAYWFEVAVTCGGTTRYGSIPIQIPVRTS